MTNTRAKRSLTSFLLTSTDLGRVHGGIDSYRLLAQVAHHQAERAAQDLEKKESTTTTTSKQ